MTAFPVSVQELEYDKERIFTRLKLREDPNTNAYAESIFPQLVELLRENLELLLAYNITDNDLAIASPELSSCDLLAVCYCGASQKIVDCVDGLMARCDFLEGYILNDLANEVLRIINASATISPEEGDGENVFSRLYSSYETARKLAKYTTRMLKILSIRILYNILNENARVFSS